MARTLLVYGDKTFKITIPDDAKVTFAPFSPPRRGYNNNDTYNPVGTLRVYKTEKNILACFSGVHGFRDLDLNYAEEVAKEEGATIWKDDEKGYMRETKVQGVKEWTAPEISATF